MNECDAELFKEFILTSDKIDDFTYRQIRVINELVDEFVSSSNRSNTANQPERCKYSFEEYKNYQINSDKVYAVPRDMVYTVLSEIEEVDGDDADIVGSVELFTDIPEDARLEDIYYVTAVSRCFIRLDKHMFIEFIPTQCKHSEGYDSFF